MHKFFAVFITFFLSGSALAQGLQRGGVDCPPEKNTRWDQSCDGLPLRGAMPFPVYPPIHSDPNCLYEYQQAPGQLQPVAPDTLNGGDGLPPVVRPDGTSVPDTQFQDLATQSSQSTSSPILGNATRRELLGVSSASLGGSGPDLLPEIMGDMFGPGALPSLIVRSYSANARADAIGGGFLGFEVGTDGAPNANDFFSSTPVTGSSTGVEEPLPPSQAEVPGSGFVFRQGSAFEQPDGSWNVNYSYEKPILVPSGAYVIGRLKLAENSSPIPRDRFFMNYSSFGNVPLTENGITVNRYTPGFEKTFREGRTSFELRTPFASTLSSNIIADGSTDESQVEFGNLFFAVKDMFWEGEKWLLSYGLSATVPTADDTRVFARDGTELLRINNESVHLMPFIGGAYKAPEDFFAQWVLQIDVDTNGNSVFAQQANSPLGRIGTLTDSTLMYLDMNVGCWLYRTDARDKSITGVASLLELHINRSLSDNDVVEGPTGTRVQNPIEEFENINVVGGLLFDIHRRSRLGFGYAVPVGNGADRIFDSELRVTFNKYY